MTWPDKGDRERFNNIIFETSHMPFGVSAYNPNEKVSDFVGRRKELFTLKEQIQLVWSHKLSRAVRLEGPAGVGKSSLFNFLKESIEAERSNSNISTSYLSKNSDIFSTYFQIPDKIQDFRHLWIPMLAGLVPGIEAETQCDIGLPEYIALHLIYKMFKHDREAISDIIWSHNKPELRYIEFIDIIEPVLDGGSRTVKQIQEYYSRNKRQLRKKFQTKINEVRYEVKKSDNNLILNLFRVLDEDDPEEHLTKINNADPTFFPNNEALITFFNDLMRIYACCTAKQPLLLLGIDEIAKTEEEVGGTYYRMLGNLFVRLRNTLNYVLFVFISTTEDWSKYDKIINKQTDLFNQIQVFLKPIVLNQLIADEMITVFKNRMNLFWNKYPSEKPLNIPYYPFSTETFKYIYRFNLRDLRKSIIFLHELWSRFRYTRNIIKLETMYESMRFVHSFLEESFYPENLKNVEWEIISTLFNDRMRYESNAKRSSAIEKGLEMAWSCLLREPASAITKVMNNPTIQTSSGTRRPDICIEIYGNLGAEYRRFIEFQVKAYGNNSHVALEHIESSLELFSEQYTDFIHFIITGKGLDHNAEYQVKKHESQFPQRIRRPSLNIKQEQYLYFLTLYEEITGLPLGSNEQDITISKNILSMLLGQQVEQYLAEIKNLAYRKPKTNDRAIDLPDKPSPKPSFTSSIPRKTDQSRIQQTIPVHVSESHSEKAIVNDTVTITSTQPDEEIKWLIKYPKIRVYKYEACALCSYLLTRETGRFKHKFTVKTVLTNVILTNANLSPTLFKDLVKSLEKSHYLEKVKTSYKLTESGLEFYHAIKLEHYRC